MVNHSKQCETLFNRVDHFPGSTLVTLANFLSVASHICHLANTAFFIVLHCCALLDKKKTPSKPGQEIGTTIRTVNVYIHHV